MSPVVLIGPPGAGCSSVGRELTALRGTELVDLAQVVACRLGVPPESALVAVGEDRYRGAEAQAALDVLAEVLTEPDGVVALGSGCLAQEAVREAVGLVRQRGAQVVALTASVRRLAHRNGLDAPRSVALGNVNHLFTQMLHERDAQCRQLATRVVDTTDTTAAEVAQALS
ncbi:shikimate kinase [Actinomyces faecalis]|uniref:shikimate kinase n=1 Tax=Actinomyces faecalis TaxID=2722820 RepID=UPI0015534F12|nr:shikimate kinase [Actinomyces faecalis]